MRTLCVLVLTATCVLAQFTDQAAAIEAVKGKQYSLSDRHGPWMIMVASFRDVPEDRREEGLTANAAAQELVYELRTKGIPAYTYSQNAVVGRIETVDRLGREDDRIYAAQRDMICVIAGNYASIDEETAQKTLQWIKSFTPEFMKQEKSGAIYRQTPGRKGPLGGAFMTINPMLSPEQVAHRKPDPEIARWNNESRFPLLDCRKPYTLQIATFTGRQTTPINGSKYNGKEEQFDRDLHNASSYGLNRAGEEAEHLTDALRRKGVEAYVHHDRFQSIVTVGGFQSAQDPAIAVMLREYGPKYKEHPETKQTSLLPETLVIPNPADPQGLPLGCWVYDLTPQVIPVPKVR